MSAPCPLCGAESRRHCSKGGFTFVRCRACGLTRVEPLPSPEEIEAYYRRGYDQFRYSFATPDAAPPERKMEELDILERYGVRGALLDVGSAHGHFMENAARHGWRAEGVEPQEKARNDALRRFGRRVYAALEDAPRGAYDAVTMWHVIEHIADPEAFLRAAGERLRPGGVLALATPNIDSLVARATGESWGWLSPPDHLFLYSPRTLPRLLERNGFEVLHIRTRRGESRNFLFLMLQAAAHRLGLFDRAKRSVADAVERQRTAPAGKKPFSALRAAEQVTEGLSLILKPLLRVTWSMGLGDEVLAVARRRNAAS